MNGHQSLREQKWLLCYELILPSDLRQNLNGIHVPNMEINIKPKSKDNWTKNTKDQTVRIKQEPCFTSWKTKVFFTSKTWSKSKAFSFLTHSPTCVYNNWHPRVRENQGSKAMSLSPGSLLRLVTGCLTALNWETSQYFLHGSMSSLTKVRLGRLLVVSLCLFSSTFSILWERQNKSRK